MRVAKNEALPVHAMPTDFLLGNYVVIDQPETLVPNQPVVIVVCGQQ
jgi:hypothetical protein